MGTIPEDKRDSQLDGGETGRGEWESEPGEVTEFLHSLSDITSGRGRILFGLFLCFIFLLISYPGSSGEPHGMSHDSVVLLLAFLLGSITLVVIGRSWQTDRPVIQGEKLAVTTERAPEDTGIGEVAKELGSIRRDLKGWVSQEVGSSAGRLARDGEFVRTDLASKIDAWGEKLDRKISNWGEKLSTRIEAESTFTRDELSRSLPTDAQWVEAVCSTLGLTPDQVRDIVLKYGCSYFITPTFVPPLEGIDQQHNVDGNEKWEGGSFEEVNVPAVARAVRARTAEEWDELRGMYHEREVTGPGGAFFREIREVRPTPSEEVTPPQIIINPGTAQALAATGVDVEQLKKMLAVPKPESDGDGDNPTS